MEKQRTGLAVVTGASTGIGYALAQNLAERGYDLIVAADEEQIEEAARQLGEGARPVRTDLATPEGVERLRDEVLALGRPVDVLAINAGVGVSGDFVRDNDLAEELRVVDLNVRSAVHLSKLLLPAMVARGRGRVLFTSSIAATAPGPYFATYAASKAFLFSFAEAIRYELRDSGVTVTALLPGPTDTDFFARAEMMDTPVAQAAKDDPTDVAREGIEAMLADKDSVVTGKWRNKAQVAVGHLASEQVKARVHAAQTTPEDRPGTR
ncbi:SDR family NAD(P)-dependent oxidoreductase [Luedemannella helvata]|uniref:SDR family NAD(P)-dependent oxidoreductase n=1 Tax=Luedemannella helvata TaxID=349315 RepID=A0ABP4VXL7_9ACTN